MKKLSLYVFLAIAGLFLGSCGEDNSYGDWANPQAYNQEDAITIPGFKATAVADQDLATTGDSTATFVLSNSALPEGFSLANARVELTPTGVDGAKTTIVNTSLAGLASTAELQALVESVYGKRPEARTFDAHVYVNAVKNGEAVLIDAGTITVTLIPEAPFIDSAYYLVGDMAGWDAASAVKFNHSGADVYADSKFTVTFTTTKADQYWKIIPQNNYAGNFWAEGKTGVVGVAVDGDASLEGSLTTDAPKAGKIAEAGMYRMTLDMMSYTYKIEKLNFVEFLYMAGDANGWNHSDILHGPAFDGKYTGYMYLTQNGFKFSEQQGWNGKNYGAGFSTAGDAANITMSEPNGFYKVDVDLAAQSYSLTAINTIGIIGDATAGGWDSDQDMTYDPTNHCWVANGVVLTNGTIKFRANDAWSISWGGTDLNKLTTANGDNISVTAGTYTIKLYPSYDGNTKVTFE